MAPKHRIHLIESIALVAKSDGKLPFSEFGTPHAKKMAQADELPDLKRRGNIMRMLENIGGNVFAAFGALAISVGLFAAAFAPGLSSVPGFLA